MLSPCYFSTAPHGPLHGTFFAEASVGDKGNADHYRLYNASHCLDLGECGQAPGGHDLICELKVWQPLHAAHVSAPTGPVPVPSAAAPPTRLR